MQIEAFQLAEDFNLKKIRTEFNRQPFYANSSELFYKFEDEQYVYLLNYGVIVFCNMSSLKQSEYLKFFKEYAIGPVTGDFKEELFVEVKTDETVAAHGDMLTIPSFSDEAIRVIMLNVGQSVTLDYYESLSVDILNSSKKYTDELEQFGKVSASKKNLLKFIGRTLNVKHSIIDNLYVFDAPDIVWDNEYLEQLDNITKKLFDIRSRYRDVDYRLKIVQDNVTLFTDLLQHREDTRLEWVIIILILIEVFDLIVSKFLRWY
jgi:required for meiotic nuclear division protein 1